MTIVAPAFFLVLAVGISAVAAFLTVGLGGEINKAGPVEKLSKGDRSGLQMLLFFVTAAQIGAAGAWIAFGYVLGAP